MAKVTLDINAEGSRAIQTLVKMAQAQDKNEQATRRAGKASKQHDQSLAGVAASWGKVATAAGSAIGISLGLHQVISLLREYDSYLGKIAGKQNQLAKIATPLATLLGPGAVRQATVAGARQGIMPGHAVPAFQEISSWSGLDAEGRKRAFREYADLMNLGAGTEGALRIVKMAGDPRLGLTPEKASAIGYLGAKKSGLSLTEFAQQAGGVSMYSSAAMGAATLAGLSEMAEFSKEELGTYHKAMKRGLAGQGKFQKGMAKRAKKAGVDWGAMDETTRLAFIQWAMPGGTDIESLMKAGLVEQRAAMAISGGIANLPSISEKLGLLQKVSPGITDVELSALRADPMYGAEFMSRQALATQAVAQAYGSAADRARARELRQYMIAGQAGFGFGVDQETAKPGWWRRAGRFMKELGPSWSAYQLAGQQHLTPEQRAVARGMVREAETPTDTIQELKDAMRDLLGAVERNTVATERDADVIEGQGGGAVPSLAGPNGDRE